MAEEQEPTAAGRRIGRYEVIREIGRGAMGRVFLALDPAIGRQVALKTVSILEGFPEAERREARERFIREARTAGGLLHPHIITIFDVGEQDGMPFIAMEYVEGGTLERHCRPPDLLEPEPAVALVCQAARALHHAHSHDIVHRDVKPANLMLSREGKLKVADFGLAKSAAAGLTQEGTILGTPYYMSPEQLSGLELDGRSDLFSLAVVLYELLCGCRPFEGKDVGTILYRIAHEPAPPLDRDGWPISRALREAVERALAKERIERFPNGEALARALEGTLRGARVSSDATVVRRPPAAGGAAPEAPRARSSGAAQVPRLPPEPEAAPQPGSSGRWAAAATIGVMLGLFPTLVDRSAHEWRPPQRPLPAPVAVDVPENARLKLDGVPLAGRHLPASVLQEPGHRLEVETPCERGEVALEPGLGPGPVLLQPRTVRLPLASTPSGAQVWVDGSPTGLQTPAAVDLTACAGHALELRLDEHEPIRLALEAGKDWQALAAAPIELARIPEGRVFVPASPYPVEVFYKGRRVGAAGQMVTLPQGPQLLVLRNPDLFMERPVDVLVRGARTQTLPVEFPSPGSLNVQAHPSNCIVTLDGRELGAPPILNLPVAPGAHEVRCRLLTTGEEKSQKVSISSGRNTACQFKF